jgi:hypothetical protein
MPEEEAFRAELFELDDGRLKPGAGRVFFEVVVVGINQGGSHEKKLYQDLGFSGDLARALPAGPYTEFAAGLLARSARFLGAQAAGSALSRGGQLRVGREFCELFGQIAFHQEDGRLATAIYALEGALAQRCDQLFAERPVRVAKPKALGGPAAPAEAAAPPAEAAAPPAGAEEAAPELPAAGEEAELPAPGVPGELAELAELLAP